MKTLFHYVFWRVLEYQSSGKQKKEWFAAFISFSVPPLLIWFVVFNYVDANVADGLITQYYSDHSQLSRRFLLGPLYVAPPLVIMYITFKLNKQSFHKNVDAFKKLDQKQIDKNRFKVFLYYIIGICTFIILLISSNS